MIIHDSFNCFWESQDKKLLSSLLDIKAESIMLFYEKGLTVVSYASGQKSVLSIFGCFVLSFYFNSLYLCT